MSSASNSWVISPKKSKSGFAMLASDPHLEISRLPQFWYMIGLHCPNENINVLGISSPGVPIIVFGHNGQAAWAFTAGGVDIADQYIEMVNPKDSTQYKAPTGWKNFALRDEVIVASDKALPETLVVRTSRHGPVMSQNDSLSEAYTMHWAGFDRSLADAAESAVELMTVNNFKDFRKIVTRFGALNANWMYADARGNIGYQLGTPIPIRQNSENVFKLQGWMDENDWNGYQPIENTPHSFNPDRGWLATCNNPPVSDEFGYRLPGNYAGDRILRIVKLLDSNETLSQSDIMSFQNDVHSQFILRWRKPVAEVLQQLGETNLAGNIGQWDGRLATDSKEAALVETWLMNLKDQTFRDELGDLTDQMHLRVLFRDRVLYRLYMEGQSSWFDDKTTEDQIETRNDIALRAMKKTYRRDWG